MVTVLPSFHRMWPSKSTPKSLKRSSSIDRWLPPEHMATKASNPAQSQTNYEIHLRASALGKPRWSGGESIPQVRCSPKRELETTALPCVNTAKVEAGTIKLSRDLRLRQINAPFAASPVASLSLDRTPLPLLSVDS